MTHRPLTWLGSSLSDVQAFPKTARRRIGYALHLVQRGFEPADWKPMPSVGLGVRELRVQAGRQFRVLYVTRFADGVYVLHAFEKRSQKTSKADLALARRRLAALTQGLRGGP